jgi:propionate catabolism operon transcriptional regulator
VNCAAFPEQLLESELFGYEEGAFTGSRRGGKVGLFEAAHTGTIFLDEIGEMPMPLQTRLLRVLQEREVLRIGATEPTRVDVRVIAATHRNLSERIANNEFRRDLYYRLNILCVQLPSLRERRDDLPVLAMHILDKVASRLGLRKSSAEDLVRELIAAAQDYQWPGNVRELENLIERLASCAMTRDARSKMDLLRELVPEIFISESASRKGVDLARHREENEQQVIQRVLDECNGNRELACEKLGISRTTLWRKLGKQ